MEPPYVIEDIKPYGPTDGGGGDTLWGVYVAESERPAEKLLVSWANTWGVPSHQDLADALTHMQKWFSDSGSAIESFRARAVPHSADHPTRRVLFLRPPVADEA